jgi:hypothetical protein
MEGRMFQVTLEGKVAWEYWSPYTGLGVAGKPEVKEPQISGAHMLSVTPMIYRAQAVSDDWIPDGAKGEAAIAVPVAEVIG